MFYKKGNSIMNDPLVLSGDEVEEDEEDIGIEI
jgi:hypothetical protein